MLRYTPYVKDWYLCISLFQGWVMILLLYIILSVTLCICLVLYIYYLLQVTIYKYLSTVIKQGNIYKSTLHGNLKPLQNSNLMSYLLFPVLLEVQTFLSNMVANCNRRIKGQRETFLISAKIACFLPLLLYRSLYCKIIKSHVVLTNSNEPVACKERVRQFTCLACLRATRVSRLT